jgi:hypothetical protein
VVRQINHKCLDLEQILGLNALRLGCQQYYQCNMAYFIALYGRDKISSSCFTDQTIFSVQLTFFRPFNNSFTWEGYRRLAQRQIRASFLTYHSSAEICTGTAALRSACSLYLSIVILCRSLAYLHETAYCENSVILQ